MKVNFWFDPTCPWCYVTSRWYSKVSDELNIPTTWEIFSLSIKNSSKNLSDEMKQKHARSLRVIRIIQAVKNHLTNEHVYKLYASIGKQFHTDKQAIDYDLETILKKCDIDKSYMKYMDDASIDKEIKLSTDNAVKVCGNDVGVPIILLDNGTKQKAMFGPVISEIPNLKDSLEMWEHFKYICFNENISELKRHRTIPYNPAEI